MSTSIADARRRSDDDGEDLDVRMLRSSGVAAIARSIAVLAVATVLTKSCALGKELVVAATFGTADALEAYLVAFVVCMFLVGLVAHSLPAAFMPVFVRHVEDGDTRAARDLVADTAGLAIAIGFSCAAVVATASGWIGELAGAGLDPPTRALASRLLVVLVAIVPLSGLAAVWSAVLHAERRFWAVSLVPATTPIVVVLALLVGPADVDALAVATVAGFAAEAVVLGVLVGRARWLASPRVRLDDASVRDVLRSYGPLVAGAALLGLTPVLDRAIAASAGAGAVATLGYAGRLVDAALAIGATALGTAMLPFAAQSVAQGRRRELRRTVRSLVVLLVAVSVPVTAVIVLASTPITAALFERGAFTPADTRAVATVQAVLALQIPIYLVGIVAARLLAAHRLVRVLFVGNALCLAIGVALDLLLVGPFGAAGIAIATVVTRTAATLFVVVACLRSVLRPDQGDER